MQMWWWRSGAHGWRQGRGAGRGARAASLLLTGRNTFEQTTWILHRSCNWRWSLLDQDASVHHLILFLNTLDDFASSQPENPYTVIPARDTLELEHPELSAWNMETSQSWRKDHSPWLAPHFTYCHYGVEHVPLFLLSMECIISWIFSKKSKAEFHPYQICCLKIKRNNCCCKGCLSFSYH